MNLQAEQKNELLYVDFNQDNGCFSCGTDRGFIVYNVDPLKERFRRVFDKGGIGIVELLFRSNILALVGGGKQPAYPKTKCIIWDDYQNKCIAELEFRCEVKAVKLRRDRIIVATEPKIFVYNFADLQTLDQVTTVNNPTGICALSSSVENCVLAYPGPKVGEVLVDIANQKKKITINAHNSQLAQIALNPEGTRLATASSKGTLIRIFDTSTGNKLFEFRRGTDRAEIYSIAFNQTSQWLCVSSDKGTIHIFTLNTPQGTAASPNTASNQTSSLSFLPFQIFGSVWSFAQFRVPASPSICAFGQEPNSVIVVCADGSFFKYIFDPVKGGDAHQEGFAVFLRDDEE